MADFLGLHGVFARITLRRADMSDLWGSSGEIRRTIAANTGRVLMKNSIKRQARWAPCVLCLLLGACSNASAKTAGPHTQQASSAKPTLNPMTDEERSRFVQSLAPRLSRSTKGLLPKRTRRGTFHLDTEGRFNHMTVATRGIDGKLQQSCVSTPEELNQLLIEKQARDRTLAGRQP
jgi:hypothetical protein